MAITTEKWLAAVRDMRRTSGAMLAPSEVSADGVGIFALRDLSQGFEVFPLAWTDQTMEAPGLVRIDCTWLEKLKVPTYVVSALRRRFACADGLQAVPVSLHVYMCHSLQQYVNEVDPADSPCTANVMYLASKDSWYTTRAVQCGEELRTVAGHAARSRPGVQARMVDDLLEARWLLEWVHAAPPVHLGASSIHGIGQIASQEIAQGEVLELSSSGIHFEHLRTHVPHEWVQRDLTECEQLKLRMHFMFSRDMQVIPLCGFNCITFQQLRNHDETPALRPTQCTSRKCFEAVRRLTRGSELTEDMSHLSQVYIDWAVKSMPGPWDERKVRTFPDDKLLGS